MDDADRTRLRALCERRSQASTGITMLPREVQDLLDDADAADRQRGEVVRRVRVALGRMGVADCDDVCDALDSAVDEMERRDREAVDEANELRRERDEARAELARLREPRPSAIVLQPVDPMLLCGLPCACDEWGTGHLDGCPNGDESTDGRDA